MRDMSDREQEYTDKGVEILAVNAFEDRAAGEAFIASSDLPFHWAFADASVTEALGVKTVPTQILLDREGRIVWTSGFTSIMGGAEAVWSAVDDVL